MVDAEHQRNIVIVVSVPQGSEAVLVLEEISISVDYFNFILDKTNLETRTKGNSRKFSPTFQTSSTNFWAGAAFRHWTVSLVVVLLQPTSSASRVPFSMARLGESIDHLLSKLPDWRIPWRNSLN